MPDLSAADAWLAHRSAAERKRRGQWVTPWPLVEAVVERALVDLPRGGTVVEPACGDGRFLLAVARRRPDLRLVGLDADPLALEAARVTLAGLDVELRLADALAEPLPPADLVLGNPPWIRVQNLDPAVREQLWARFRTATDKNDIASCFVEHALAAAPRVAFVLPRNWLSLKSFHALREAVAAGGGDGLFELPDGLFGARVQSVALFAGAFDGPPREQAGTFDGRALSVHTRLHRGPHSWTLDGPPPELPGRPLGDYVTVHMGVVCGDYDRYVNQVGDHPLDRPTARGRDVAPFRIEDRGEFVRYDPRDMLERKPWVAPKHRGLFDVAEKVVLAGASGRVLRAAVDDRRRYVLDSCYVFHPREGVDLSAWALAGLLNAPQVADWYGARHPAPRVKGVEVVRIPVPTPPWPGVEAAARAVAAGAPPQQLEDAVAEAYLRG